jgi:hypothetical protein
VPKRRCPVPKNPSTTDMKTLYKARRARQDKRRGYRLSSSDQQMEDAFNYGVMMDQIEVYKNASSFTQGEIDDFYALAWKLKSGNPLEK